MSDIYYALIIFPIIFMLTLSFIFASSVVSLNNQQFLMNCPFPVNAGIASISTIENNQVIYTITYDNATSDYHLTLFECNIVSDNQGANTIVFTESATNWFGVGNGYLAYFSNSISSFFQKIYNFIIMLWLFIDAPAQVSNLSFFTYINLILTGFIGLGGFMVIRGN